MVKMESSPEFTKSTSFHVDNEMLSKKDQGKAPKKSLLKSNFRMRNKNSRDCSTPLNTTKSETGKMHDVSGLGDSPDTGYQSEIKSSPGSFSDDGSNKISIGSEEFPTPVWSKPYDNSSPDTDSLKTRKRIGTPQRLFNDLDSDNFAAKVLEDLKKRPNQTMGIVVLAIIIFATFITVYRLNSIQRGHLLKNDLEELQGKFWTPSTNKGAQNGKYASIEYAHEKKLKQDEFKIVDEYGNPLGGKKAAIQFAYDMKRTELEKSNDRIENKASIMLNDNNIPIEKEVSNYNAESNSSDEINDNEEDFYDALQLLDDLKQMGDLLKQKSFESKEPQLENGSVEAAKLKTTVEEEKLKKLRSFKSFATTKLRPLDLEKTSNPLTIDAKNAENRNLKNNGKFNAVDLTGSAISSKENEGDTLQTLSIKSGTSVPKIKLSEEANMTKKRKKSFNRLYNAYSAKILRLIEKKKEKAIENSTNDKKRSVNDEDDPFRFH